jgi:uncharacterized protein YdbL (DUF1318 family)
MKTMQWIKSGLLAVAFLTASLGLTTGACAQNVEVNTPAVNAAKAALAGRHAQLAPHYASGAVGIGRDGMLVLRDANAVPLPQRGAVTGLVSADNNDRATLYREIAKANGKPEWEGEIQSTFAQRWVSNAQGGWYVQNAQGAWTKK